MHGRTGRIAVGLGCTLAAAIVLLAPISSGWGGPSSRSPQRAAVPDPAKTEVKRGRTTLRLAIRFSLRDVRLTRAGRRGRVRVVGRPVGRGVLRSRAPRRFTRRIRAASLAGTYGGLVGRTRPAVRFAPGLRVRLATVTDSRARRLSFRGRVSSGSLGGHPRRLRLVRVRVTVHRRAPTVGRCPLVPFAKCPGAELGFANLYRADLRGADLVNAKLQRAFLHSANLAGADLAGADLRGATLVGADLRGARLDDAILADAGLARARIGTRAVRRAYVCRTRSPHGGRRDDDCKTRQPRHAGRTRRPPMVPIRTAAAAAPRQYRLARAAPGKPVARAAQSTNARCQTTSSDQDGDCLADATESAGWTIAVVSAQQLSTTSPNPQTRSVKSSPPNPDTDGDGPYDAYEYQNDGDPTEPDTDGDGLADGPAEASPEGAWEYPYGSDLNNADSDGDSAEPGGGRAPELFDGQEATGSQTSPRQADTDGDGQSDYVEVTSNSAAFNPLVAQIPQPTLISNPGDELSI